MQLGQSTCDRTAATKEARASIGYACWSVMLLAFLLLAGCSAAPSASTAQKPLPSDTFAVLAPYKDPNGKFTIDVPGGWSIQPQRLVQDNMKAATSFVGREGFVTVVQFDFGKIPSEQATQLIDSFLQVTNVTSSKGYKELARVPVSPSLVMIEMEYTNSANQALHTVAELRIDGTRISLVTVNIHQDAWPRAVEVSKQILNSYTFTDNKGG